MKRAAAAASERQLFSRRTPVIVTILILVNLFVEVTPFSVLPTTRKELGLRDRRIGVAPLWSSQWDDSVDVDQTSWATPPEPTSSRSIARLEKFSRLPVWPVWNGVFIFIVSKLFGEETAAKLEDAIGGRVCPNFFQSEQTSPFIMLVHHRHSFAPWDPLRFLQRTFFPEGFPAHPHRGPFLLV